MGWMMELEERDIQEIYMIWVVFSNIFFFHPYLGKIPILTNIFQRGWNHQLVMNSHFNFKTQMCQGLISHFYCGVMIGYSWLPWIKHFPSWYCSFSIKVRWMRWWLQFDAIQKTLSDASGFTLLSCISWLLKMLKIVLVSHGFTHLSRVFPLRNRWMFFLSLLQVGHYFPLYKTSKAEAVSLSSRTGGGWCWCLLVSLSLLFIDFDGV